MPVTEKIIRETSGCTGEYNIFSLNAGSGNLFLSGEIKSEDAVRFAAAMKCMENEEKDVSLFINSPGGEVNAGLMIYDIIQDYPYEVNIFCTGFAASMAALILAGGRKGHRWILPHSKVMIHEPLIDSGFGGSATTIEKQAQGILQTKALINSLLAEGTGKSIDEINKATSYDNVMNAKQAIDFGICDGIGNIFECGEEN